MAKSKIPQIVGPPGGGGGGSSNSIVAMVAQQQEMNDQYNKLVKLMQQMQEENAAAVQEAAQAGGGAATQVANQVAQGLEKQQAESARSEERAEDKAFAEDMQRLNSELQASSAKEARVMGQKIMALREKQATYIESWESQKNEHQMNVASFRAHTLELSKAGRFASDKGRATMKKREWAADMMEALGNNHFNDRYLSEAMDAFNRDAEAQLSGRVGDMDLSTMVVDPIDMPVGPIQKSGLPLAPEGSIDPDMIFELKLSDGYPPNGVILGDPEDNFGMPEGHEPNMMTAKFMWSALMANDRQMMMLDESKKHELNFEMARLSIETHDKMGKLKEMYTQANRTYEPKAARAVQKSWEVFLADPNPHKYDNVDRYLLQESFKEIFGGGSSGDKMAQIAFEVLDGKREFQTVEESLVAMHLESAAFNIKQKAKSFFTGEGGAAVNLMTQMKDDLGEEGMLAALGVDPGGVGTIDSALVVQDRLAGFWTLADQMHTGFYHSSSLTAFRDEWGASLREVDLHGFRQLKEAEDTAERANHLLNLTPRGEVTSAIGAAIDERSALDASNQLPESRFAGLKTISSDISLMIEMGNELGFNQAEGVAAFASGNLEAPEAANLGSYRASRRVIAARNPASASKIDGVGFVYNRQKRAKQNAKTMGESFQEGGVAGAAANIVSEKFPALLGYAGGPLRTAIRKTKIGLDVMTGGREFAERGEARRRTATEGIARGIASVTRFKDDQGNLTEDERNQILGGGQ